MAIPLDNVSLGCSKVAAGHLCLHASDVTETMEQEANLFAAELLMPSDVIRSQLRSLSLGRLHDLKREWGVSMQALIERARDLETIMPPQRTNLYKLRSYHGWRIKEPLSDEIGDERPSLISAVVNHLAQQGLSERDIKGLAGIANDADAYPFNPTPTSSGLRLVR